MLVGVLLADHPGRDDIVCCATELATNAIQHTTSGQDGYFAAEVTWVGLTIRVSVADTGADSEPFASGAAGDEDTEHGLDVLARLSTRCGADGDHRGRVVWAEFVPGSEDAPEAPCPLFPELAFQAKTAELRERYADWHTWFGPWTRQWWAAPRNGSGAGRDDHRADGQRAGQPPGHAPGPRARPAGRRAGAPVSLPDLARHGGRPCRKPSARGRSRTGEGTPAASAAPASRSMPASSHSTEIGPR